MTEQQEGSARDIDYTSGVAEPPTEDLETKNGYNSHNRNNSAMNDSAESQQQQQHHDVEDDDNDMPHVHDQLPNVEEVRMRAASALSLATTANRATNTARLRSSHLASRVVPRPSVMKCIFWTGLIFMVIAIIILVVGIVRNQTSGAGLDRNQVEQFLLTHGYATTEELQDASSPQWDAVSWLVQLDGAGRERVPVNGDDSVYFLQRYVLVLLYYATNGPFWTFNRIIGDRNSCEWKYRAADSSGTSYDFGAVCNDDGIVTTIFLPETNLDGTIPKELGYLSNLEHLALYGNILKGSIPSELQLLTNLRELTLYDNALTGSIPSWIDQLTLLQVLRLSSNMIVGSLPSAIGKLTNLVTLGLDDNSLEGDIQNLQDLKNMKRLYLSGNSFSGPLDSVSLLAMRNLEELDLSGNDFEGAVPIDMFRFPKLRILDLGFCGLSGPLPSGPYTDAPALTVLSLAYNDIKGSVSDSIGDLSSLTHLALAGNAFSGSFPLFINDMTNLKYLSLSENPFDASSFPDLARLTNLEDLLLKSTNITGNIPALTQLTKLVLLDLDGNNLEGEIPTELSQLTNLQYLFLNRNDLLVGDVPARIQTLPELSKSKYRQDSSHSRHHGMDLISIVACLAFTPIRSHIYPLLGVCGFRSSPCCPVAEMLLLSGTSISGSLTQLCNRTAANDLDAIEEASADCFGGGDNQPQKEVECDCCTICCGDDTTEDEIGDVACLGSVYYGDVDPIWQGHFQREDYDFTTEEPTP